MAGGVPAIGSRGEDGPAEIAAAGGGIELVTPRDPAALADQDRRPAERPEPTRGIGAPGPRDGASASSPGSSAERETVEAYADALEALSRRRVTEPGRRW